MAENTVSSKDTPRQETIQPYFPNDYKIIKKLNESGTASYHHPMGGKVYTYSNDLHSQLNLSLVRFKLMVDMLDDDDLDKFGFVFESLIRDAGNQLDEIFKHVNNAIGGIELEIVGHNRSGYSGYRNGMIVGAKLGPCKKATESPETAT